MCQVASLQFSVKTYCWLPTEKNLDLKPKQVQLPFLAFKYTVPEPG